MTNDSLPDYDDDETHQARVTLAKQRVEAVREHFVSSRLAAELGMPGEGQTAGDRMFGVMSGLPARDVALMVAVALLPEVNARVADQLDELADFRYIDERKGLVAVPPRRRKDGSR